jgi:hypothetical protein
MNLSGLRVRRATVDDLPALTSIWNSMRLPAGELEKRLTEFQVVIGADGIVLGAIGFLILRQHALLHSEGYSDFSIADDARKLFWDRIQNLTANHGVFRLWTQENSPFWLRWGFQPANNETLMRLPTEWKNDREKWFTLELKNEDAINDALKNQFAGFMAGEKKQTAELAARGKKITTVITIICFVVFFISLVVAIYLFMHRNWAK